MKPIQVISLLILPLFSAIMSCTSPQKEISGNYKYETFCLGQENDGSVTLKAWGYGLHRPEAVEAARKNAVSDVLFKIIRNGRDGYTVLPVINETNAREKYADYFNTFFADDGPYTEFITKKYLFAPKVKGGKQSGARVSFGVMVRVMRQELILRMKKDGILK